MRKLILIIPVFLSGCFMYNNVKQGISCSFDDAKCAEIAVKTDNDIINGVFERISSRCSKQRNLKKGTIELMECNENLRDWYEVFANEYGVEESAEKFMLTLSEEESKCTDYGMKEGTKTFSQCLAKLEEKDMAGISKEIQNQRRDRQLMWQAIGSGLNSVAQSQQQANDSMVARSMGGRSCTSRNIGGTVYTNCY